MSLRKVGASSAYITISTAAISLFQWAVMALIARIQGPEALGNYALAQAFVTPTSYLAWLGLRQKYLVSSNENDSELDNDYIVLRLTVPALLFLIILGGMATYYRSYELIVISFGVFALKYAEGFFDIAYGRLQQSGRARAVATTSVVRVLVSVPVFSLAYFLSHSLAIGLGSVTILWLCLFAVQRNSLWPVRVSTLKQTADWRIAFLRRSHIAIGLVPIAISFTLMSLVTNVPRLLVENRLGTADLGYFAAAFHFLLLGSVIVGSVGHAVLPGMAHALSSGNASSFWRYLLWPVAIVEACSLVGVAVALLIGTQILSAIYGSAFGQHAYLLVWSAAVAGPVYVASILGNGCYAADLKRTLLWLQIVGLLATIVCTLVLVSSLGIAGAFLGVLTAALIQSTISVWQLVRFWRNKRLLAGFRNASASPEQITPPSK